MKTKLALFAATAAAVSTPLVVQQQTLASLRGEQAALESSTQQLTSLQEENATLQQRKIVADELQQLLRDHEELLRLREETQRLKGQQGPARTALLSQLDQARAALDTAKTATAQIEAIVQSKEYRTKTIDELKLLGLAARIFAYDNQDRLPTAFDEITDDLGTKDINLDRYEFVKHARLVNETEPQMLLFREKEPRQLPDGNWAKAYARCDGSVQEIVRPDKSFVEWEKDFIATESTSSKTTTPATP